MANESIRAVSRRVGRALGAITGQTGNINTGNGYGSWLLGTADESTFIQRIRIQLILTVFVVAANLIGIGVVILLVTVAFPTPNVFDAPAWVNFVIVPVYIALAVPHRRRLGHPAHLQSSAVGVGRAPTHQGRPTQRLRCAVASHRHTVGAVGRRRGVVHSALRAL